MLNLQRKKSETYNGYRKYDYIKHNRLLTIFQQLVIFSMAIYTLHAEDLVHRLYWIVSGLLPVAYFQLQQYIDYRNISDAFFMLIFVNMFIKGRPKKVISTGYFMVICYDNVSSYHNLTVWHYMPVLLFIVNLFLVSPYKTDINLLQSDSTKQISQIKQKQSSK